MTKPPTIGFCLLLINLGAASGCHSHGSAASPSTSAATSRSFNAAGGTASPGLLQGFALDSAGGRDPYTTAQGDSRFQP